MRRISQFFIFTTIHLWISFSIYAVPLDFDSDSLSNFSTVEINSDNSLRWIYESSSAETIEDIGSFGVVGNHLMPGFYTDSETTLQAVVDSNGVWTFANGMSRSFGAGEDLFIGGADYDGDTISDISYATNACRESKSLFKAILNPLESSSQTSEISVGAGNQYKFFFDSNNDGRDDICYLKQIRRSKKISTRFRAICKSVISGERIKSIRLGKVFSQPRVLRADNEDSLLLMRSRARSTRIKVLNSSGKTMNRYKVNHSGVVVLGNFINSQTEEIALVEDSSVVIIDPLTGVETSFDYPEGIPYDLNNIEHFSDDQSCFCTSQTIKRHGGCVVEEDQDSGTEESGNGSNTELFIPNNCSNPPQNISANDGFKCIASSTRGGSVVCLLSYQFTWKPHVSKTDQHGNTFACNATDDHFTKAELVLNSGERIDLTYAGCHNYVGTAEGQIGRQHFRNESIHWSSIENSVQRIEMTKNGSRTCLRF